MAIGRLGVGLAPPADDDRGLVAGESDEQIVAHARANVAAFAPLYQRYARPIYGYCYRRLGDRELAEDATSLIFARALEALPRHRGETFRPWLFAIARNVVVDGYRRRRAALPLDAAEHLVSADPPPVDAVIAADERRSLVGLLAGLTPDQRDVVELRLAGLTGTEIAAVLGKRPGAIRATQFRAFQRLRDQLTEGDLR